MLRNISKNQYIYKDMSYFRNTIPKLFDVILAPVVSLHDGSLKRLHSVGDCRKLRDSTAYLLYLKNKQKFGK